MYTPKTPDDAFKNISVTNGMYDSVKTEVEIDGAFLIKKGGDKDITYSISLPESIQAPVRKGDKVGKIIYKRSGERIAEYPITAAAQVDEISFWQIFGLIFGKIIK